jgi:TolB-like protein
MDCRLAVMPDIFLSYSRDDQATARLYAEGFEREGLSVWWDQTLRSGESYDEVTEQSLQDARAVVVLWSRKSVSSRWVRAEATQAERGKKLMPVMIEPCTRPIMFELTHTADMAHWKGDPDDAAWKIYAADVRRFVQKDALPAPAPVAPRSVTDSRNPSRRHVGVAVALVAALALGTSIFWATAHRSDQPSAGPAAASAAGTGSVTLAVLPFANLSSDPEQEYFSDGLTEEILNQLAQVEVLSVTARTSSFSFKGKNEDVRTISQKLGVANLLEGSIRKDRNQLRITAQLVSGKDGSHLWSQTYDRELSSVFALQEEIAKDVAIALSIKLDVGETRRARGGTTNLQAYDQYLQAVAQLNKGYTMDSATQAVQFAREAVLLDPAFARARETLVRTLRNVQVWRPGDTAALRTEIAAVEEGTLKLAPDSVHAQRIRLDRFRRQRNWLEAESLLRSAARDVDLGIDRMRVLGDLGRMQESLPEYQRMCHQDPVSIACSGALQTVLTVAERHIDAEAEYQRSKALDGGHNEPDTVAMVRNSRMGVDSGIVLAQLLSLLKDANVALSLDRTLVDRIDSVAAARALLRKMSEDPANQEALRMWILASYALAIGDTDLGMTTMRHGVVDMGGNVFILWGSSSPAMRTDPRFKQMLRDVGLIDFFRASGKWNDFCQPVGKDDFQCH